MVNILIVENDFICSLQIEQMIEELGKYNILGVAPNALVAIQFLSKIHPDLIIMDINLSGEINGIELALLPECKNIPIVFISSYSDENIHRATLAIPNHALLIKPFHKFTLESTIDLLTQNQPSILKNQNKRFFIRSGSKREAIDIASVIYVIAERNYCTIITKYKKNYTVKMSLTKIRNELPVETFISIHKSIIVSINSIKTINVKAQTITLEISQDTTMTLPIGRTYLRALRNIAPILR